MANYTTLSSSIPSDREDGDDDDSSSAEFSFEMVPSEDTLKSRHDGDDDTGSWSSVNHETNEIVQIIGDDTGNDSSSHCSSCQELMDAPSDEDSSCVKVRLGEMAIEGSPTAPETTQRKERPSAESVKVVECDYKPPSKDPNSSCKYPPMSPIAPRPIREVMANKESQNMATGTVGYRRVVMHSPSPFWIAPYASFYTTSQLSPTSSGEDYPNHRSTGSHHSRPPTTLQPGDLRSCWDSSDIWAAGPSSEQPPAMPRRRDPCATDEMEYNNDQGGIETPSCRFLEESRVSRVWGGSTLLAASFQPPHHLMFSEHGTFREALMLGTLGNRPVLVSLQSYNDNFACLVVNRDIFRNEVIEDLIRSQFVFWQTTVNTFEGRKYAHFYNVKQFPHISIIHPKLRSYIWVKEGWSESRPWDVEDIVNTMTDIRLEKY